MDIAILLVVILIIVLIWRGPAMLPRLGEAAGRTVKGVRENLPGMSADETSETTAAAKSDTSDEGDSDSRPGA